MLKIWRVFPLKKCEISVRISFWSSALKQRVWIDNARGSQPQREEYVDIYAAM